MDKWWNDPRLDDEGTYDYLVEELPKDTASWSWWYSRCDSCCKYHKLNFHMSHHFYCWDGWDSMDYTECWVCRLKMSMSKLKYWFKRKTKLLKLTLEIKDGSKKSWKHCYELAKKLNY